MYDLSGTRKRSGSCLIDLSRINYFIYSQALTVFADLFKCVRGREKVLVGRSVGEDKPQKAKATAGESELHK